MKLCNTAAGLVGSWPWRDASWPKQKPFLAAWPFRFVRDPCDESARRECWRERDKPSDCQGIRCKGSNHVIEL
jgi:hypothetical protein